MEGVQTLVFNVPRALEADLRCHDAQTGSESVIPFFFYFIDVEIVVLRRVCSLIL